MNGAWAAILSKWLYKKKLIIRCGYEWLNVSKLQNSPLLKLNFISLIEKIAYKVADKIILTSKKDKEFVEKRFKIPSAKIEIIPNYIDIEIFKPLPVKKEERIIFVGRLEREKNLFNLIEAITNLPLKLIIIGNGHLRDKLEAFSKNRKANVEFKGNIPNDKLPEELNKSKIFILPSLYEGCPKVLLEAMACGLPCIGTNVDGINEVIKHKENGYLCKTNSDSIRKAIKEVLNNENLKKKITQNARRTVEENFNLKKFLEKEIEVYKSLII
jgi:glycosyltransferase involved in cell wall biosynthesis